MFGERRKHFRFTIDRVARIQANVESHSRECTITDISETGARLFVGDRQISDQLVLWVTGDRPARQSCQVVWRLGGEVGVRFVDPENGNLRTC